MIKNLGQVAGIYIGNVAPSNTTIIWCNPTILPYSFKVWGGTSWVDLATQEWVKITIGGYLISLPAKTIANDNDYLIINDGTNDNKIKVVDFVRSAVGNPLDFKGVIRVAADFPAPATLEGGDMYIIITSPSGGTVTDPYSGKTFKDTEKIVWDSVTNSWESLGLVKIEVNLGVDTKEDSVVITNTAGSSATIPTASASKAGVMSSQLLRWLTNLINGTTVLATPDPSNPNIPAHKHNYSDLVNYPAIYQTLGQSTEGVISQRGVTDALAQYLPLSAGSTKKLTGGLYFNGVKNLLFTQKNRYAISTNTDHESESDDYVFLGNYANRTYLMSTHNTDIYHYIGEQGSISSGSAYRMWDAHNLPNPVKRSDLTAYLLLSGGIMTGGVTFNNNLGLYWKNTAGSVLLQAYFNDNNVFVIGNTSNSQLILRTGNTDVLRDRNGDSYKIWDSYNLPNPAGSTDLDGYLPLTAGVTKQLTGQLFANQGVNLPFNVALRATNEDGDIKAVVFSMPNNRLVLSDASYDTVISSTASDLIHSRTGTPYKIWDAYNLSNPALQNGTYSGLTAGKVQGTIIFTNGSTTLGTYNGSADLTVNVGGGQPSGNYLPLAAGASSPLTGKLYANGGVKLSVNGVILSGVNADGREESLICVSSAGNVEVGDVRDNTVLVSSTSDLIHRRGASNEYKIWDAYNLSNPALQNGTYSGLTAGKVQGTIIFTNGSTTLGTYNGSADLTVNVGGGQPSGNYLPLAAGASSPLTGKLYANGGVKLSVNGVILSGVNADGREESLICVSSAGNVEVGDVRDNTVLVSSTSDLIHRRGASNEYKIWDAYNLSSPAKTSDLANYIPRAAENNAASLLTKPGGIYRQGASVDGEFGYSCNMLLRFDSGGTNWYTGGILSISTGGELRVAGVLNGALSVWRNMAVQGMANNFLYNGNEVTFISQTGALSGVWLNYRGCAGGITDYLLGSGKGDGTYGNLVAAYIQAHNGFLLPNGKTLASKNSAGVSRNLAYISAGSDIAIFGDNLLPLRFRSTNGGIAHSRWINNEEKIYTIWDSYDVPSPVSGSGGVAGQLAKWSAATALSGGIAYASANTAAALVARDGNGAFSASTVTVTNANITNLNPAGENCVVQSGLIPRATSTCFLGSASRIFQNIYGNNIYAGVALLPVTTATVNIGTADLTYKSGYIQTIHTGGVLPLTTASSVGSSANPFSSMFATTFNGSATKWNGLSQQVVSSLPSTLTPNTMYFVTA